MLAYRSLTSAIPFEETRANPVVASSVSTSTGWAMAPITSTSTPASSSQASGRVENNDPEDEELIEYDKVIENHPRLLKCEWVGCKAMMGSYALLSIHLRKIHCNTLAFGSVENDSPKRCQCRYHKCANRQFGSSDSLMEHITNHHLQSIRLSCPVKGCKRPQQTNLLLRRHLSRYHELDSSLLPHSNSGTPAPSSESKFSQIIRHQTSKNADLKQYPLYLTLGTWVHKHNAGSQKASRTRSTRANTEKRELEQFFQEMWDDDAPLPASEHLELYRRWPIPDRAPQSPDDATKAALWKVGQMYFGMQIPKDLVMNPSQPECEQAKSAEKLVKPAEVTIRVSVRRKGHEPDSFVPRRKKASGQTMDEIRWSGFAILTPKEQDTKTCTRNLGSSKAAVPQRTALASLMNSMLSSDKSRHSGRPSTIGFEALKAFVLLREKVQEGRGPANATLIQDGNFNERKPKRKIPTAEIGPGRTRSGKRLRKGDD